MRDVSIASLIKYIEFISGRSDRTVSYRGAKDPVEDMKPTVVRSWQRNRQIRGDRSTLSLWEYEERLIEAFKRQSLPFLEAVPDSHLNWLAVAQHHELPTRLLDWTRNPLIALYFAAINRGRRSKPEGWSDVFVFMWEISDAPDSERPMLPLDRIQTMRPLGRGRIGDPSEPAGDGIHLFTPPTLSSRIASQEGLFSFEEQLSETPFPEYAERNGLDLTRIRVEGSARIDILKHLNRLGVETGKLFPDLPGLCAHQRWVAEWLW
ncbi:MAG TPA: FRG domain-containing protein [Azospirillum sp.]|nr:FRG domain-containing protein [Azospirillum sp.]